MFRRELKVAVRSLWKTKSLAFAVIVTLALGIGVNVAIFSLVRAVLLKPLVNRNEDRIVYIRQSAPGVGSENITFSVPEIQDLRTGVRSLEDVAEFSVLSFTVVGLGEPRQVRGGVVSGNYFGVMGLRPVLGRLLNASDDGPAAAGAVVLTHQFWSGASIGSERDWKDDSAQYAVGPGRGGAGAIAAISGRDRTHRQPGVKPSPHGRDDVQRSPAPDDRSLRAHDPVGDARDDAAGDRVRVPFRHGTIS